MRTPAFLFAAAACIAATPFALVAQERESAPVAPSLPANAAQASLLDSVEAILSAAPAGTRYGLMVTTLDGRELLAIAPDQRFMPASNTKIFTTVAAYHRLSQLQDAARGTGVRLEPAKGKRVDVVLEGGGDPDLSSASDCTHQCLATLADAVAVTTRVVHDIVGDASFYPDERWTPGMSWNNMPFTWGTAIGALVVDDNEAPITIAPGEVGARPKITGNGFFTIRNDAITVEGVANTIDLWRNPGSSELRVSGTIGSENETRDYDLGIDDPALYAAFQLKRLLEERGVKVTGAVRSSYRPLSPLDDPVKRGEAPVATEAEEPMLMKLPASPIADDVRVINKVSQNLHASLMLRRLGKLAGSGSIADGRAQVSETVRAAGVGEGGWFLADGSGMSSYNRVTPRTTATLLQWVAGQPWGEAWRATLPVGGIDGTLARRYGDTGLNGRIFAKTGSINASRALSGYMEAASGQMLVFSAFANDIPPDVEGEAIAAMDAALQVIAAAN